MTPEFGYYTALICVSTGMMVFCALLSAGSRALPTPQRRMMFVPFCIVMVTAFLEGGGEAIEELPMALAMFDAALENERKDEIPKARHMTYFENSRCYFEVLSRFQSIVNIGIR